MSVGHCQQQRDYNLPTAHRALVVFGICGLIRFAAFLISEATDSILSISLSVDQLTPFSLVSDQLQTGSIFPFALFDCHCTHPISDRTRAGERLRFRMPLSAEYRGQR